MPFGSKSVNYSRRTEHAKIQENACLASILLQNVNILILTKIEMDFFFCDLLYVFLKKTPLSLQRCGQIFQCEYSGVKRSKGNGKAKASMSSIETRTMKYYGTSHYF